ncbi:PREDICTED: pantothenate kinase 1-like isoform X1 [Populus euphratica]|uniref:pantothenate kinase n=1 Tax=Populus euphratica TaxID=75702 RepID=A0AAJ6URF6_POPEU|nr:PREDICTED: pantothenate kinase 1-like isoform X1 [Populus euphratica]
MEHNREVEIDGNSNPIQISRLALDIGGSLIKLVYFSRNSGDDEDPPKDKVGVSSGVNGRLHFAMFETAKINDCLQFISANKLLLGGGFQHQENCTNGMSFIKATGGGAYKFSELFKEKLGIILEKEDEMDCLVTGANFLLKAVNQEAFTYLNGSKEFVQINHNDLYPYLLVNIGSGVSMIKVDGDGKFERVSGTSVGGGTFWGLGKLLTKCQSFDELLELSHRGDNKAIDTLVGDIYGGMDYSKIGLSSTTIASSFGKATSHCKELEDYKPEDISWSLLRMISNNIGQISYLNALRFGLKRIFFGGFFIRSHSYTMDTIAVAVHFWSKGEAKAMFLRHEGFLGALGAFMSYERHSLDDLVVNQMMPLPVNASLGTDTNYDPLNGDINGTESIQCSVYRA